MQGNKLRNIEELQYNWNENGAKSFSKKLIDKTKDILQHLNYPLSVFPTARNSIQLEYEDNYIYFEIEIYEDKLEVYSVARGKEHYYNVNNIDEINNLLRCTISGQHRSPIKNVIS